MKKVFTAVLKWFGNHWRGVLVSIIITVLAVVTLSLQLNDLIPGQNRFETETLANLKNFPAPWHRAVNAPYTIPAYLLGKAIHNPLQAARVVSVVYGLLATALMFYVVRSWFNIRIATVGTLLFITSSWLLHTTHQATPLILLVFGPLLAVAALTWFLRTKKYKSLSFFLLAAALALTAYIPYMPWVVLVAFVVIVFLEKTNKKFKNMAGYYGGEYIYNYFGTIVYELSSLSWTTSRTTWHTSGFAVAIGIFSTILIYR